MVQWLRHHLPVQGLQVPSLVRELRSHLLRDAAKHTHTHTHTHTSQSYGSRNHTHTHTHTYIYIYRERENEVEAGGAMMGQDETRTGGAVPGTPNR